MVTRDGWLEEHRSLIEDVDALAVKLLPEPTPVVAAASSDASVSASAAAVPRQPLLDRLRQEAERKQREDETRTGQLRRRVLGLSEALERAHLFLAELVRQLNILQPLRPRAYPFHGTIAFDGLSWRHGETDYQLRTNQGQQRVFDKVTLRFRLAAGETLRVVREPPALGQLREALEQWRVPHIVDEARNDLGKVVRGSFVVTPELAGFLTLWADDGAAVIRLRTHNVERFGNAEFAIDAAALDIEALEELGRLLLGEPNRFLQKFGRVG